MTDLAWLKTFAGTHLASTSHLSPEEFGVFERLRLHYWMRNGLPNDDAQLMRMSGVTADRWEDVRSAVCGLFEEGRRLPELDAERGAAAEKRERKVAAGQKGAAKRWHGNRNGSANPSDRSYANGTAIAEPTGRPMAEPMDNQWPSASASDEVRYEERLAPTHAHAPARGAPIIGSLEEPFLDSPETDAEGKDWLIREGLWPKEVAALLPKLMGERLRRSDVRAVLGERRRS